MQNKKRKAYRRKENRELQTDIEGRKKLRVVFIVLIAVLVLFGAVFATYEVLKSAGKKSLLGSASTDAPELASEDTASEGASEDVEEEGVISHLGKKYRYNENMITILCMGIDKQGTVEEEDYTLDGGQSDTNLLVAFDTGANTMKMITISRDTITKVKVYGIGGNYIGTEETQLALAHGYGDGKEGSCELAVEAVSNLMYGLPIHGYCALNMGAVPKINDAVGGVELTVLEDLSKKSARLKKDAVLTLTGKEAYIYTRERDWSRSGTNTLRMQRQKQYALAFVQTAKAATKQNLNLPIQIYQEVSKYMVTDLEMADITYLASLAVEADFNSEDMINVEGTVTEGDAHDEYHVDEDALYELILDTFYEEVQ